MLGYVRWALGNSQHGATLGAGKDGQRTLDRMRGPLTILNHLPAPQFAVHAQSAQQIVEVARRLGHQVASEAGAVLRAAAV